MAYPRAAPPAKVAAEPNLEGLAGFAGFEDGRGGFWGAGSSSKKAPGMDEGRGGFEGFVDAVPP